jgi:filamentous hemagglutinin family protein
MDARLVLVAFAAACLPTALVRAQTPPPRPVVPLIPTTALPKIATVNPNVYGTKNIGLSTNTTDANKPVLTITQPAGSTTNIVNWDSFNIGADAKVLVSQPTANSVLLNNVVKPINDQTPTVINGVLKNLEGTTPGRVYIYDPRGIVFGSGATVNLNSLIASSLKFDESRIKAGGLLMPGDTPADAALKAGVATPGAIWVQPGANISVENGGQIMLAAPGVYNEGRLYAPDGQVVLAAGNKVYLASPDVSKTGTRLRGLLVEVENGTNSSVAENGVTGNIDVSRGNATMVGYAVNQNGMVSASTSVTMNGSIYLTAKYLTAKDNAKGDPQGPRSGDVKLGAGSVTQITPFVELDPKNEKTITLEQLNQQNPIFNKSEVTVLGKNIQLAGRLTDQDSGQTQPGASILAPGGTVSIQSVNLQAVSEPTSLLGNLVRVDIGEGSTIDVAGMRSAQLAMSSNIIKVDLRGTELADNLVLRESPLYGKTINVDIRKGTGIANIDGWLKLVPYKLDQVNTAGGKIAISSEGAVIQRTGSLLNVDGGGVTYLSGYANASQLKLNDTLTDVSLAKPNVAFTQVVNLPDSKNNWEEGYTQGSKAGSVSISGQVVTLLGDMSAAAWAPSNVLVQSAQRDVSTKATIASKITSAYAAGGALSISVTGINKSIDDIDSFATLTVGNTSSNLLTAAPAVDGFFNLQSINAANNLRLNMADLKQKGFQSISASVAGDIVVSEPVVMLPKGALTLNALEANNAQGALTVSSSITAPSGTIALNAARVLDVKPNVTLSAAGLWTNDVISKESRIATNGGSVNLQAHEVILEKGVTLDASAGAWVDSWQKIKLGNAGAVNLGTALNPQSSSPAGVNIGEGVLLNAEGFASGGTLAITTPTIYMGSAADLLKVTPNAKSNNLLLTPDFFQQGGFTSYNLTSFGDITVLPNTQINPIATRWVMNSSAIKTASGDMASVAQAKVAPIAGLDALRAPPSLTWNAQGALLLDANTSLTTDPLASVTLLATNKMSVLGDVVAPGGNIWLGITDDSYASTKNITLGKNASLNVNGGAQAVFTAANGVSVGNLTEGGSIKIGGYDTVSKGLIPLNALIVAEKGSSISADGSIGSVTLNRQTPSGILSTTLASNAGSIDIESRQGFILAGSLSAKAGANAVGGTLNLVLGTGAVQTDEPQDPSGQPFPHILNISSTSVANKITKKLPTDGNGWVALDTLSSGGFGRIQLRAQDAIAFNLGKSAQTLAARDAIVLDSPVLRADSNNSLVSLDAGAANGLTLSAPSVQLGGLAQQIAVYEENKYDTPYLSPTPTMGSAFFTVNANTLDLVGTTSLQGFKAANLNSRGDIRLTQFNSQYLTLEDQVAGQNNPEVLQLMPGVFGMQGDLTLTGSQIYPTTLSAFKLSAGDGNLKFLSNGNLATPVYSAGGSLTVVATNIEQSGVVKAPLGQIILGDASTQKLDYSPNSVTSVKGEATMIYGAVSNGSVPTASVWNLTLPGSAGIPATLLLEGANNSTAYRRALPTKEIVSQASDVNVQKGALLDASAGGQLLAFEFTPGGGGSVDVLNKPNTFAILPSYQSSSAPVDPNNSEPNLKVGDKIYLSASSGLAAGVYTLLPSHFALLPGGYSVQMQTNTLGMAAKSNYALPDGSMLVSGSRLSASQSTGNNYGFQVTSGDVIRKKSQFTAYNVNDYFNQQAQINLLPVPELPTDSGYMQLLARNSMTLNGNLRMPSGVLDISILGQPMLIASDSTPAANTFDANSLSKIQASSLLMGGVRATSVDANGQHSYTIQQLSKSVELANSLDSALTAKDIILTATDAVTLKAGSSLVSTGLPRFDVSQVQLVGDGALLRATGGTSTEVVRDSAEFKVGTLNIDPTASITANGALYLDATRAINLNGRLPLPSGGFLGIASNGINFGDTQTPNEGVLIANDALANTNLKTMALTTYNQKPIGFSGAVKVGAVDIGQDGQPIFGLSKLTISASGLFANDGSANVFLNAQTVQLNGVSPDTPSPSRSASNATLNLYANDLLIGNHVFAVTDFATSQLTANQTIRAAGDKGAMIFAGDAVLQANTFTAASAKSARFESLGTMSLEKVGEGLAPFALSSVGGSLVFTAPTLNSSADIVLHSGNISLNSSGYVSINNGLLSVAGANKLFGVDAKGQQLWAYAPAGDIAIAGNTITLKGGSFDVSAMASAGSLSFTTSSSGSTPAFVWDSSHVSLRGMSDNPNQAQGQFTLETNKLLGSSFSALNKKVNETGFQQALTYRLTDDDVRIANSDTLTARNITLIADNGNISMDGTLNASGWMGGNISLYAAQASAGNAKGNIYVNGLVDVSSTYTTNSDPLKVSGLSTSVNLGKGGRVLLSTATLDGSAPNLDESTVSLQGGEIRANGASDSQNGSVLIRVPRTNDNLQLALNQSVNTSFTGAKITLEGFKVYGGYTDITQDALTPIKADATNFPIDSLKSNLIASNPKLQDVANNFSIRPGVEIRSDSSLTISVNELDKDPSKRGWDLYTWRFGQDKQPINLTLRSAGDLTINGSISDGFEARAGMGMPNWALGKGPSADINVIAGADFASANTLATNRYNSGSFTLGFAGRVADPTTDAPVTAYDMPVSLLRTGTGNINIAASSDVVLKLMSIDQLVDAVDDTTGTGNIVVFDNKKTLNVDSNPFSTKHFVTVVGASIYTAGEVDKSQSAMATPQNLLNLHYVGDASKQNKDLFTNADFSKNGGSLTVQAGGNIQGPVAQNPQSWYYNNNDTASNPDGVLNIPVGKEKGARKIAYGLAMEKIAEYTDDTENYADVSAKPILVKDKVNGDYYQITFNDLFGYKSTQDWLPTSVSPLVNTWLFRQGRASINTNDVPTPTAWWVRTDYFNQSMATLGGGNLVIRANGSINDIYASTATNAYTAGSNGSASLLEQGGGDLTMLAKGDLAGVAVYVQKGIATLATQGSVTAGGNLVASADISQTHTKTVDLLNDPRMSLNSIVAMGDTRVNLTALKNIAMGAVYNPTLEEQSVFNRTGTPVDPADGNGFKNASGLYSNAYPVFGLSNFMPTQEAILSNFDPQDINSRLKQYTQFSNFSTYSDVSGVSALSLGGSVALINDHRPLAWSGMNMVTNELVTANGLSNSALDRFYTVLPGRLQAVAMKGALTSNNGFVMMPSSQGQLALWAEESVSIQNGINGVIGALNMLDVTPQSLSNANSPRIFTNSDLKIVLDSSQSNYTTHALVPLHQDDVQMASVVSLNGDVIGDANYARASFNMPKATTVLAGRDILNLGFTVQNNNAADVTLLQAGRDIRDETIQSKDCTASGSNCLQHLVYGPGLMKLIAGRDIDLGNQSGVVTKGNQSNPFLPEGGASIELMTAGLTPDYASWNNYINNTLLIQPSDAAVLEAWNANFLSASTTAKNKYFFQMLNAASGYKDPTTQKLDLTYFDGLINAMFPTATKDSVGNLSSHSSQIKTEQGGSIDIFALAKPEGSVYAGLTMGAAVASPANQGMFTIRGGDINALVYKDFLVNQGRVFTLSGGDITLVSKEGNLEAGKGAKTASSAPPPLVTFDTNGNIKVDVSNSIAGSGIGTLYTRAGQPKSSVYTVAPRGYVDAGDAGIQATGDVKISSLSVRNADNIVASGSISNSQAPSVVTPAPASVSAPATPAPTNTDDVKKSLASNTLSNANLSVELLGLGDGKSDNANTSVQAPAGDEDDKDKTKDKP